MALTAWLEGRALRCLTQLGPVCEGWRAAGGRAQRVGASHFEVPQAVALRTNNQKKKTLQHSIDQQKKV